MIRFLFWNLNKKDLGRLICDAVRAETADVVILIENSVPLDETLEVLKSKVSPEFHCPPATVGRFQLFSRTGDLGLSESYGGDRLSLRCLNHAGKQLLLGIVHIVDKMNWDQGTQSAEVQLLSQEIRRRELQAGHERTVLIGDFNMNPFDQSMNMATGLNAMMTTKCVERGRRKQQNRDYPFFYNPMWGLFGDRTPGPPGTYYHSTSSRGNYGWNMLDQVLVRPQAIDHFDGVRIITSIGETLLTNKANRPHKEIASDHFPILLCLK